MTIDIEREIQEAFHENAHNQGFCLDQKWSDCDNPYLDHDTHLAYEFYKDGWQAAKAHEAKKLEGCVVVPVEPTDEIIEAMDQFDSKHDYADMYSAYKAMVEAARGGNE